MVANAALLNPNLPVTDPVAAHWLAQASLRLRLELLWLGQIRAKDGMQNSYLPDFSDRVQENLDQLAFSQARQEFFESDPTAAYLLAQLAQPTLHEAARRGAFARVQEDLDLSAVSCFVLALAVLPVYDCTVGPVIAACLNDERAQTPNLALAQRLWHLPEQVLELTEPNHPLYRHGLLQLEAGEERWTQPIRVAAQVAWLLISGKAEAPLLPLRQQAGPCSLAMRTNAARARREGRLRLLPLTARSGSVREDLVAALEGEMGRPVKRYGGAPALLSHPRYLCSLLTLCWLLDLDLYLDEHATAQALGQLSAPGLPEGLDMTLYLACKPGEAGLPAHLTLPPLEELGLTYQDRHALWREHLGERAEELGSDLAEVARRFRFQARTIADLSAGLKYLPESLNLALVIAACRARFQPNLGETAQLIQPRFGWDDIVLPAKQRRMFSEIDRAMRNLTRVHYQWGTADAWNESGISVLFAGPPGTGKTMAAEILARSLDMPLYRIDLSQLVSKYIGETEKNLASVFDAADEADMILLFDEADALFGRRTDVKDAHDRFANIEVSYLLQRMETFKGLAILATNRKKDLDEAFQRRLRYIVDFPLPSERERELIWRKTLPAAVPSQDLDLVFLARQFPLAGGHIRSIVFNACLQAASCEDERPAQLTMAHLVLAVSREFAKLDREVKPSHFGAYAALLEDAYD